TQELSPKVMCQIAHCHAPRLADRRFSPRQWDIFKMSSAFKVFIPGDEHFSAPDIPVGAITSPIQGESDHSTFKVILRHTTCNVGVVVLHANQLRSALLQRPFSGEIVWVKVIGDDFWPYLENPLEVLDGFVEKTITLDVFQISNVLA